MLTHFDSMSLFISNRASVTQLLALSVREFMGWVLFLLLKFSKSSAHVPQFQYKSGNSVIVKQSRKCFNCGNLCAPVNINKSLSN